MSSVLAGMSLFANRPRPPCTVSFISMRSAILAPCSRAQAKRSVASLRSPVSPDASDATSAITNGKVTRVKNNRKSADGSTSGSDDTDAMAKKSQPAWNSRGASGCVKIGQKQAGQGRVQITELVLVHLTHIGLFLK